jgi:hypothetical protein
VGTLLKWIDMVEQHRISYILEGGGGIAYGEVDPSKAGNDGYISFSALNLWQTGPVSVGLDTSDVAYIVEVTAFTISEPYGSGDDLGPYGTGSTRRVGAYRLIDGYSGTFQMVSQSDVEWLGGQIYPEFHVGSGSGYGGGDPETQPEIKIRLKLALANGYYLRTRYYIKVEAWQPL